MSDGDKILIEQNRIKKSTPNFNRTVCVLRVKRARK